MNYSEIISKLIDLGLSPLPVAPYQATPVGKKTGKPIFTGKNPSYLTGGAINAEIVNHSDFQNTIPNSQFLEVWFRYPETGIGCLGSHRYRWLDLDRKHFANQGDCDLALLQICPHAQDGWLEQTQSGGYRLLVDCGETGADFTNFSLTEGGDHVGELLGAGRFAVIAPTKGVNGQYTNLNYGAPIPLSELNIFTTAKKREAVSIKPSAPNISTSRDVVELFSCVTPAVKAILTGTPESDDRSADITKAARELYGWQNWLNANGINYSGSADDLINDCGDVFGVDGDRVERIKKTIDPSSCLPACVIKGGDEAALLKVKKTQYPNVLSQDLRYSKPVTTSDTNDIELLSLLPKKYIEAVRFGVENPHSILSTVKGLLSATEEYLINKSIKYQGTAISIFNQFCENQEPPIKAAFESIPSDDSKIDIPQVKKVLDAHETEQRKIRERIEKEALRAEKLRIKEELKGQEKCELAQNISAIKKHFSDRFRLNLLTKEVELDGDVFDIDTARIYFGEEININISKNDAIDVIGMIAESNKYHPVFDYLESLECEDVSILDGLAEKCFGVSNPLYEVFLKKTLIAAVARVYYPLTKFDEKKNAKTAKVDHVFCLVSTQGAKKSSFFEALAGEPFFTDNLDKELAHKDNIMRLHRKWICEIG